MKKVFVNLLIIMLLISGNIPYINAQEVDPLVGELTSDDVITISNGKPIHKLKVHDTEIIKYTITLDKEYEVLVELVPNNVIALIHENNELHITAKAAGEAKITILVKVKDEDITYRKEINFQVYEEKASINFNQKSFNLIRGLSFVVDFEVNPKDTDLSRIVWQSSNTAIATVEAGKVSGHKIGTTTISATLDGQTQSMEVNVTVPLQKIEFNPTEVTVYLNEVLKIPDLIYVPYDTTSDKTVSYSVQDPDILVLEGDQLRGLKVGTTYVKALVRDVETLLKVNVKVQSILGDNHTLLLEVNEETDSEMILRVRDFTTLEKLDYELYLPTQEVLKYMENRELTKLKIVLEPELLTFNLNNLSRLLIDKEILLQLGAQKLEIIFSDTQGNDLFKAFFGQRHKADYDLSFNFEKINTNDPLFALVRNNNSFKINFNSSLPQGFEFGVSDKLFESEADQFHFLYTSQKEKLVDKGISAKADSNGFVWFDYDEVSNVISLSPLKLGNNNLTIIMMGGIVLGIVGFGAYRFQKLSRKED